MARIFLTLLLLLLSTPAFTECPPGTYPWVDEWGNKICKSIDNDQTRSIEGSTKECPPGTHPWVDEWGNPICEGDLEDQQFYDTSKGCPPGTYPWVDEWGNPICIKY